MRDQLVEGPGVTDRMLRLGSNLRTRPQTNNLRRLALSNQWRRGLSPISLILLNDGHDELVAMVFQ